MEEENEQLNDEIEAKLVQKLLNKLISEEWLAGNTYLLFKTSIARNDRNASPIVQAFDETAIDELSDHMEKLVDFAIQFGYAVPSTFKEFKKFADKNDSQLFETFKKDQDSIFYLDQSILSEQRAIASYNSAIAQLDDVYDYNGFQALLKTIYYDEVEHLETFKFLKYQVEANLDIF